tara:strand:+ start:4629 stop:5237 length:609 start_codon:yes stop_codon:yes gene_type:complete
MKTNVIKDSGIVLASNNKGKLREFLALLSKSNIKIFPQSDFKIKEVEEDGLSFVENALKKARNASLVSGKPAIADDSGIEVDALNGAPGIHSARYSTIGSEIENNIKLLGALKNVKEENRGARYQCVIVFLKYAHDPMPIICHGTWEGKILREPRGRNGFGYDPLFFIPDLNMTAAELSEEQKNQHSHRAKALKSIVKILLE